MAFLGKVFIWALIVVMGVVVFKVALAALGLVVGLVLKLIGFVLLVAIAACLVYGMSRLYRRVKSAA
jgi:hypothetical protein